MIDSALLLKMIEESRTGNLERKRFYDNWPDDLEEGSFYGVVMEDIEFVVEHYPDFAIDDFKKLAEFKILNIDEELICSELDMETCIRMRKSLDKKGVYEKEDITLEIQRLQEGHN
jgi:hypothetical protein